MNVSVYFTIFAAEDPYYQITDNEVETLPAFWTLEGPACAAEVAEQYFIQGSRWDEWFGDDDAVLVMIQIHEPKDAAGVYEVHIEKVLKASARKTKDPRK